MRTLTIWLAAAALAGACKSKPDQSSSGSTANAPAPAPAPPGPPVPPQPAPAQPTAAVQLGSNGLPTECDGYKAAIDKLSSCPKLAPDAKDSLVQAYQAASASWARLPVESRRNLVATCKAAIESVNAAAKTQCGW